MLTEVEMERARIVYDLVHVYQPTGVDFDTDLDELLSRASEQQMREIMYMDDPESARMMLQAGDDALWRRRPHVTVLPDPLSAKLPGYMAVRRPGWRQDCAKQFDSYLKLLKPQKKVSKRRH